MQGNSITAAVTAIAALLVATAGSAAEPAAKFDFNATVGADYDSNVGIAELDENAGAADSVASFGAGIAAAFKAGEHVTLRLGWDYDASRHRQFSEFDLGLQHAVAGIDVTGHYVDAGLSAERFGGRLDGEPYLTVTQYSPNVSKLIGDRVFLRGALIASRKRFDELPGRDAHAKAYRFDTYLLLDGMDRYVALAWQDGNEDAASRELDYRGRQGAVTYGYRLEHSRVLLKTQIRYEWRDYLNVTEAIGAPRRDRRLRVLLTASVPVGGHCSFDARIERVQNDSTFDPAALDKYVGGLSLEAEF